MGDSESKRGPAEKKPYHHGNLPRALIDAVLSLVSEKGVTNLTMREVARKAEVSHNAPYAHFADMEALLAAVAQEGIWLIHEILKEATEQEYEHPLEKLEALCILYVRFAVEHREYYRIMFGPHISNPMEHQGLIETALKVIGLAIGAIKECQEEGYLKPDDPGIITTFAWSTLHGLANLVAERRIPLDDLEQVDEAVKLAIRHLYYGLAGENLVLPEEERDQGK
jgi:AcrR family transcriptional regulator